MATIDSFQRKLAVLFAEALALCWVLFLGLGLWNRLRRGWSAVFFCYPGEAAHVERYAPPLIWRLFRFFPMPIGILNQAGTGGLVMAAPVTEDQILHPDNAAKFERLQQRLQRIARVLGASQINLAGILPGALRKHGVLALIDRREIVVGAVLAAARHLRDRDFCGAWPPVIVLGGAGYIGTPLVAALHEDRAPVHVVDPKVGSRALPDLGGAPALLLEVARAGALDAYVPDFWPGITVLNENAHMHRRARVRAVLETGGGYWHLAGVRGTVPPPLPTGYAGAVPCCAAHAIGPAPEVALIALRGA